MIHKLFWKFKQLLAYPSRFYGNGGTIHNTNHLDIETRNGEVVAVWFRCATLPFEQVEVNEQRAKEMRQCKASVKITGVEFGM